MFAGPTIKAVGCGNVTDVLGCLRAVDGQTLINIPSEPKYDHAPKSCLSYILIQLSIYLYLDLSLSMGNLSRRISSS